MEGKKMKLRNKITGEVKESDEISIGLVGEGILKFISLTDLNEQWEDYKSKEPLIKDEKVRKAVRAWADANEIGSCVCKEEIHCITFETERGMFISFETDIPIPEGNFTITELCGKEEE